MSPSTKQAFSYTVGVLFVAACIGFVVTLAKLFFATLDFHWLALTTALIVGVFGSALILDKRARNGILTIMLTMSPSAIRAIGYTITALVIVASIGIIAKAMNEFFATLDFKWLALVAVLLTAAIGSALILDKRARDQR